MVHFFNKELEQWPLLVLMDILLTYQGFNSKGFTKGLMQIKHTHPEKYEINGDSGKVLDSPIKFWKWKGTGWKAEM